MRRLFAIPFVLVAGLGQPNPPAPAPAPPPSPLVAFRTRLTPGDPDRSWLAAWTADGNLELIWTLGGVPATSGALSMTEDGYDAGYHGAVILPAGVKPGKVKLDAGRGPELDVTVVAPVTHRTPAPVPADANSLATVRSRLAGTPAVVTLAPGEHVWAGAAYLPAGTVLRGYGATIRQVGGAGEYNNRTLVPTGADVSVYGVTIVGDCSPALAFHADNPGPAGLVVGDVTLRRINAGYGPVETLWRDCRFESAGAVLAPPGLWLRCTFTGPPTQHAWSYWYQGPGKPVAMIDGTFDGTDRGPIFNLTGGPFTDGLFVGTRCRAIMGTVPNGGECFTFEGAGPFDRNLFFHSRFQGCSGPLFQWGGNGDGAARNNLIRDLYADGGLGLVWWGADVSANTVQDWELRGCGVYLGPGAKRNALRDGTAIGWLPTRGNQTYRNMGSALCDARRVALWAEGPESLSNTLANVDVIAAPAGVVGVQGFGSAGK